MGLGGGSGATGRRTRCGDNEGQIETRGGGEARPSGMGGADRGARQKEIAVRVRRDGAGEAEIFELCADWVSFGEVGRARAEAISVGRSGDGSGAAAACDAGAEGRGD